MPNGSPVTRPCAPSWAGRSLTGRRPRPARRAASRPSGSRPRRTWRHSPPCPARGSTGCTNAGRPTASSSTWIAPRARPLGSRKARPGTATSAARATTRSLFVFNQFGDLERCMLRPGNVHSPDDWRSVLVPVSARYRGRGLARYFRGDAAFAKPELYALLEAEGIGYSIRLSANCVVQECFAHRLSCDVGRPTRKPQVFFASFTY